ncbi:MAG: thioesterase family protein, partial [Pseudomonadota bacterium]
MSAEHSSSLTTLLSGLRSLSEDTIPEEIASAASNDTSQFNEIAIPNDWMQGRTTYGGLTAAISLQAIRDTHAGDEGALPPLRSAMVNFIGPVGGAATVRSEILRRGKSAVFANADVFGEKGLAARSVFIFGAARPSAFDRDFIETPDIAPPDQCESFFPGEGGGPAFTVHFDMMLAKGGRPISGSTEHDHFLWVRFREDTPGGDVMMMALADIPPPAMLPMFTEFAPVSSITW